MPLEIEASAVEALAKQDAANAPGFKCEGVIAFGCGATLGKREKDFCGMLILQSAAAVLTTTTVNVMVLYYKIRACTGECFALLG